MTEAEGSKGMFDGTGSGGVAVFQKVVQEENDINQVVRIKNVFACCYITIRPAIGVPKGICK